MRIPFLKKKEPHLLTENPGSTFFGYCISLQHTCPQSKEILGIFHGDTHGKTRSQNFESTISTSPITRIIPWKFWAKENHRGHADLVSRVLVPDWPENKRDPQPTKSEQHRLTFCQLTNLPRTEYVRTGSLISPQIWVAHAHLSLLSPLVVLDRPNNSSILVLFSLRLPDENASVFWSDGPDNMLVSTLLSPPLSDSFFPLHSPPVSPSKRTIFPRSTMYFV